jgi:DNA-binding transcriptional regulator YiaG
MITILDLKAARAKLGLSQAAFAREIGVNQTTVWGWEHDNALPKNKLTLAALERRINELLKAAA